ncbi:hypothetical protein BN2537_3263 [Streptomyces venezuelae]|nr:hypothetical protein BN2537_3263 [Streptomyces venezuelae]
MTPGGAGGPTPRDRRHPLCALRLSTGSGGRRRGVGGGR